MDMDLRDAVVLVTGGTGALGTVVVQRFLDEGCHVVTTYIESEEWDDLKATADTDRLTGYKVDVTADEQVDGLVQKVVDEHGRVDVLLNLVGAWKGGDDLHEVEEETWDDMFDVNLKSAFLTSKHVVPVMQEQGTGRIISMGAKTGVDLPAQGGPYAIAKRGVAALTEVLAKENREHDITANCILPSVIDTAANREIMGAENADKWVKPERIADKMVSLVQDPERTGERVKLYGGLG